MNKLFTWIILGVLGFLVISSGVLHLVFLKMHWPGGKEFFLFFKTFLTLLGLFVAFLVLRIMLKDNK